MSNFGGIGTLEPRRDPLRERRSRKRKSVLSELGGSLVMVTLGSQRGLLLNLCAGGISVRTQNPLTSGATLSVQFLLPLTEACINPTCEVVWASNNCGVGLRFLQLAEKERLALGDWLASHGAEPGDVLAEATPSEVGCALVDDRVPAQSARTELAVAMQTLMPPPAPLASGTAPDDPPTSPDSAALEDLLQQVVSHARWLTKADGAALVLRSEEGIVCRASAGSAPAVGARLRSGSGLSGECFQLGQVVRCDDAENDSRVNAAVTQRLQSRAILIAPIQVEGSTRGVLQVLSSRPFAFHAGHTATLLYLAGLVGSFLAARESAQGVASAVELEAAQAPEEQLAPGEPAEKAAEIAQFAPDLDSPPITIAEAEPRSRSNLGRYGALIGVLGLLVAASLLWVVIRVPHPTKATQKMGSPQQAQPALTPAQPSPAASPKVTENGRKSGNSLPPRPVPALHHADAGTLSPRGAPKRPQLAADAPRRATPLPSTSAGKSDSKTTVEENPSLRTRVFLPSPAEIDSGKPDAIAAVLGGPPPAPAIIASPSPVRVSEGVVPGRAISQPKPAYPQAALRARVEGQVVLAATIGTDGRIKNLQVVTGDPRLVQAALDAVKNWRYQPSYLNGAPVEIDTTIKLRFKLP